MHIGGGAGGSGGGGKVQKKFAIKIKKNMKRRHLLYFLTTPRTPSKYFDTKDPSEVHLCRYISSPVLQKFNA
jgi:hypothetical protein